jgi:hypothetical protein
LDADLTVDGLAAEVRAMCAARGITPADVLAGERRTVYNGNPSDSWAPPPPNKTAAYTLEQDDVVMVTKFVDAPDRMAVVMKRVTIDRIVMYEIMYADDYNTHWQRRDGLTLICRGDGVDGTDWDAWNRTLKTREESLRYYGERRRRLQEHVEFCTALAPAVRLTSTA